MLQPAEPHLPVDLVSVAPAGARSPLTWLTTWRERRFAGARCRELLQLHHAVAAREPALTGSALYRRIVAERIGAGDAAQVLQRAEDSFANWPVSRALNFRDVAHYLVVTEFIAAHAGVRWLHTDIRRVVEAAIPQEL